MSIKQGAAKIVILLISSSFCAIKINAAEGIKQWYSSSFKPAVENAYSFMAGQPTVTEEQKAFDFYGSRRYRPKDEAKHTELLFSESPEAKVRNERAWQRIKTAGQEKEALYPTEGKNLWLKRFGLLKEANVPTKPLGAWRTMTDDALSRRQEQLAAERFAAKVQEYGEKQALAQERGMEANPYSEPAFNEQYRQQQRPHLEPRSFSEWTQWLLSKKPKKQRLQPNNGYSLAEQEAKRQERLKSEEVLQGLRKRLEGEGKQLPWWFTRGTQPKASPQ